MGITISQAPRWLVTTVPLLVPISIPITATLLLQIPNLTTALPMFIPLHGLSFVMVVGVLILGLGKLGPGDIGLRSAHVGTGILITGLFWIVAQGVLLLVALAAPEPVAWHPAWQDGFARNILLLAGNLFGTALFEETTYRGFLLPQFGHVFMRSRGIPHHYPIATAVLVSSLCFSFAHLPILFFQNPTPGQVIGVFLITLLGGLYGALVYVRTQNLFVAMGLHALNNSPLALVTVPETLPNLVFLGLGAILLLLWPHLTFRIPWLETPHRWLERRVPLVHLP